MNDPACVRCEPGMTCLGYCEEAMTPEGKVKAEIKAYLDSIGAYYFMPVQMGYGAKTLDFLCCVRGRFVAIEAKRPGKDATLSQKKTIGEVRCASGLSFVVTSSNDVRLVFETHELVSIPGDSANDMPSE